MKKEFLIKESSLRNFSLKARIRSLGFALEGVLGFFRTEHNAIIHLMATVLVLIAAIFFKISRTEMIAIAVAIGFVWTAEMFNTAIEKLADTISGEFHPKIKFIKDVSAAAVLVSAITAFAIGSIVFIPKFFT